jgi:7-cyano-7-deazaguanine synthase in queuosine biosynthesis
MPLVWPDSTGSGTFNTKMSWDLDALGIQRAASADLLRIAATAYLADRTTRRGATTWTREITIRVPVSDPSPWKGEAGERLVDLLWWLTGDIWELEPLQGAPFSPTALALPGAESVMLLSGGLDSLCGAINRRPRTAPGLLLGHAGTENAVRRSQRLVYDVVLALRPALGSVRVSLSAKPAPEPTSRTRSLLFMALGSAAAADGGTLAVPENGFTSVNLALQAARGGACSTRSTHPATFRQVNEVLRAAGVPVEVFNPHANETKGQMVRKAATAAGFQAIAAETISCSKLNGRTYADGDPNAHCGLCVACIVRRAAFIAGGVQDDTKYLVNNLPGPSKARLVQHRQSDVDAVKRATARIPSIDEIDSRLVAAASWVDDMGRRDAAKVYRKGLQELANVPLP